MGKNQFDFILFENSYCIENHYRDVLVFARMLQKMGYVVAIADVFKERLLCESDDVPHVSLRFHPPSHFSALSRFRTPMSSLKYTFYRLLQDFYLIYAIFVLRKHTRNLYVGSLMIDTPLMWLTFFDNKHSYYLWGLRSGTLTLWQDRKFCRYGFYSRLLNMIIRRKSCIKIVTSNDIIRDEFIDSIGVPSKRIIVRPERWIANEDTLHTVDSNNHNILHLLTLGTLRRSKHVEYVIDALRDIGNSKIVYTIAGRCKDQNGYEEMIMNHMKGMNSINRINRYLEEDEYEDLFKTCDFFVLCDERERTCGSNGTMLEAVIKGCPIIAPNHEPYKTEIEKYGIGLLYDLGDINTLKAAIVKAKSLGKNHFEKELNKYKMTLSESNVIQMLKEQIERTKIG